MTNSKLFGKTSQLLGVSKIFCVIQKKLGSSFKYLCKLAR